MYEAKIFDKSGELLETYYTHHTNFNRAEKAAYVHAEKTYFEWDIIVVNKREPINCKQCEFKAYDGVEMRIHNESHRIGTI